MEFGELLEKTGVSKGHLSRILLGLEEDELIVREADGTIYVPEPDDLLAAWIRKHTFRWHKAKRRLMAPDLGFLARMERVAEAVSSRSISYAFTGYSASRLQYNIESPQISTVYLAEEPTEELLEELGATKEYGDWNLWLITPRDEGVLTVGAEEYGGLVCAHPVQSFLDLLEHPEVNAAVVGQHLGRLRGETKGSVESNPTGFSEELSQALEEALGRDYFQQGD